MVFTMYKENIDVGDIFFLPKSTTEIARTHIYFNPYQEDSVVYCVVTKVNKNKSINGTIINADLDYGEPMIMSMARSYTNGNHTHFMWLNEIYQVGSDTKRDLINRYPEKFI